MDMTLDAPALKATAPATDTAAATVAHAGEYLSFRLGPEEYGVDILHVQEIRSYEPPTRMAHAPHFIKGVVNLRGVIVPVVDLRLKLGCERAEYNASTVVIVLNVRHRVLGAVVDSVSDVLQLADGQIKPAPALQSGIDGNCITGIGCVRQTDAGAGSERMLQLVDIERMMSAPDMALLGDAH
jgi:purine-binding chemotaxis protein CheW